MEKVQIMNKLPVLKLVFLCAVLIVGMPIFAQQIGTTTSRQLATAEYARAENFMNYRTAPLVFGTVRPNWISDERFWYRNTTSRGSEFLMFEISQGTRRPVFDHAKLAAALSSAAASKFDALHLPFNEFEFSPEGQGITFN